jgi:hypothetical protein
LNSWVMFGMRSRKTILSYLAHLLLLTAFEVVVSQLHGDFPGPVVP